MQSPNIVDHAPLQPGSCLGCGSITGPYIDTLCDIPVHGRAYLCVHNCVGVWAETLGYADPVSVAAMHENAEAIMGALNEAASELETVKQQLAEAIEARPNVVSLDTVRQLLGKGTSTKPVNAA